MLAFNTERAEATFRAQLRPRILRCLHVINELRFSEAERIVQEARELVDGLTWTDEAALNDIFVLKRTVAFVGSYSHIWADILSGRFGSSWSHLQDSIDSLEVVSRFSNLELDAVANQLFELEKAFPYRIFCSAAFVVSFIECSICGLDIDSEECPHRRGELYSGQLAQGVLGSRGPLKVDHLALVERPADKRCVLVYADEDCQFGVVRYLADLVNRGDLRILDFVRIDISEKEDGTPCKGSNGQTTRKHFEVIGRASPHQNTP